MTHLLFSYGTLQLPAVQAEVFGGSVPGEGDAVIGFVLRRLTIEDPKVVALSGTAVHPVLVPAPDPVAQVDGTAFTLTDAQLAAADDYEVDAYVRRRFPLRSGRDAWVYVLAAD
ncbi:gamma-glutamylcyclotransferase [Tsukamurella sp. 8F]|uniref:gamma-glutamylcyclotransferase family protein n=1 Tax=unclassified Tsukamurella TaxID=2633480 RepID=UPI0023BA134F|nr:MULTISPECIES: gamma-glutamylcyclotransferase family protein [unclassified Tsukamurella]MDF0531465.1 gamma-glutamylcyclotransferase [Tsukamurella sp. 8J]MDF0587472.1 gamma-glutamylcyclotransferase [Tsukamurella sp. 8F]